MDLITNVKMSKKISLLIVGVLAILIIISGIMVLRGKADSDDLANYYPVAQKETTKREEIDKTESNQETKKEDVATTTIEKTNNNNSSLCTDEPTETPIGRSNYPVDPKYKNIGFLGQLFTAFNCGPERLNAIFGVKGNNYTLGSSIWLKDKPNESLTNIFNSIGYKCIDTETACKRWQLWTDVPINELIKLEPFYEYFESDDCTKCG